MKHCSHCNLYYKTNLENFCAKCGNQLEEFDPFKRKTIRYSLFWIFGGALLLVIIATVLEISNKTSEPLFSVILIGYILYFIITLWILWTIKSRNINFKLLTGKITSMNSNIFIFFGFITMTAIILGTTSIEFFILNKIPKIAEIIAELKNEPIIFTKEETSLPFLTNTLMFIQIVLIAPIIEELSFRGILLSRFSTKWNLTTGIILSSILFGILHMNPLGACLGGIVLAITYIKTQTLIAPILLHIIYNACIYSLTFFQKGLMQSTMSLEETVSIETALISLAFTLPIFGFFMWKYWPQKNDILPYKANSNNTV